MTISCRFIQPTHFLRSLAIAAALFAPVAANAVEYDPEEIGTIAIAKLHDLKNRASELTMHAMSLIGIRYKYGGNAPESGLDCSGLVRYVFREVWGTQLPRTSEEISRVGQQVDKQDLQPGDLVFYNTLRRGFSHVGIYLGDNKFVHAPSSGGQVRIENMEVGYWKKRFDGARRILRPEEK
ncbi:MAG TPA: C40 family peptidase [Noviherbaspirillum sp.]|uniref:C40 family peptidase n=1 Tax=Noviherbaspirillum sp. TaxID=1926288 RepID=UPI002DDD689E|nr:C40 family peptidase [Noviherbaspirillum sp.]HEV2610543.1 C40 family peptidase [Noviherbaspirillum sp.]